MVTASSVRERTDLRNVALIAHVDHGKTTLVDRMLQIAGALRAFEPGHDLVLDSFDQERERGITILAKNCSLVWGVTKINLLDTPGHADFGGEVERVIGMADGCLLLVDAAEGPMPQTRFVLRKALEARLRPIVVVNKLDRKDARPEEVLNEVYDLFIELGADEELLDFPVLYGSGRAGVMSTSLEVPGTDLRPLMDVIVEQLHGPSADPDGTLQMLVSNLVHDAYAGRIAVGRIHRGRLQDGDDVMLVKASGEQTRQRIKALQCFQVLDRVRTALLEAGDVACVVGLENVDIGDSLTSVDDPEPLPPVTVEPPTISMQFSANDSPFRGLDGPHVTSRKLKQRLMRELERNVALQVELTEDPACFRVSGRGLLHLGVFIETMRREGFEVLVGRPEVILREGRHGTEEPFEQLVVSAPILTAGRVIELVGGRRGELLDMVQGSDRTRLRFRVPARGLIGLRGRLLNATGGEAVVHHVFDSYGPWCGEIPGRQAGVMVSMVEGECRPYALNALKDRGTFFVGPGDRVYEGMVVGEHRKENDIVVNTARKKHLTNIRAAGSDDKVILQPPRRMSLEEALAYVAQDELVEVTPNSLRLRKKHLTHKDRKRAS